MKLLSWNVAGRTGKARAQVVAIAARSCDVVALQEVTVSSLPIVRDALLEVGFPNVIDSVDDADGARPLRGPRRYGQLIASRFRLDRYPSDFQIPWPERMLSCSVELPGTAIEIHTTHVPPGSSNGWIKVETLEGIYDRLAADASVPRILCGDFNTPQQELANGTIVTWAQRIRSDGSIVLSRRWKSGSCERWDAAERRILHGLAGFDLPDLYRTLNGYGVLEGSWVLRRKDREFARRYDHIFASEKLNAVSCSYVHGFRTSGLSDHSAVEAVFGLQPVEQPNL